MGRPDNIDLPLVRVQSSCLTSIAFGALTCDCADQLHMSLRLIADLGVGCVLYMTQEGRGHGLLEKVSQLEEVRLGLDTVHAALRRGVEPDVRDYGDASVMLRWLLGDRPIRLLTNNPTKLLGLEACGVRIGMRVPIEVPPTDYNMEDLQVKKQKMGHILTNLP